MRGSFVVALARIVGALLLHLADLLGAQAEDVDVVLADLFGDLDVGAVAGADGQRAVHRQLHVAGAGGLHAGRRNLLAQVGGGNDRARPARRGSRAGTRP